MLQSTGGLTSKCYRQRGDELLNLAFLLQSDKANQSQCFNALQSATVAQFDKNFRAMLFGYICLRFYRVNFFRRKARSTKALCEDAIGSKVKADRLKDREVFVCDFSKLQFK